MDEHADEQPDQHAASMGRSIRELERAVREHEQALQRLREAPMPAAPSSAKGSLEMARAAFEDLAGSKPFLPHPGSVLPALVAMRKTHRIIQESRAYLASQKTTLESAKRRLQVEQAHLRDQRQLQAALESRAASLRSSLETRMDMTDEHVLAERLDGLRQQKRDYDRDTTRLLRALGKFVVDRLAPMLAAEALGGPVVGDTVDVDADDLAAGFTAGGRPRTRKKVPDQDKRQRRIDEIWGTGGRARRERDGGVRDEAAAAGAQMRSLIEELLNRLVESGGDSSAAYVAVPRESAATRFLVRSKVAQFHPKDATRLRLVDFGRELDD